MSIPPCSVNLFTVSGDDNCESCNDKDAKEMGGLFQGNFLVFAFQAV
jgi:hypothetical protein